MGMVWSSFRAMAGRGFLEALRCGRGLPALLLAIFLLHPALNVFATAPSPEEQALLADLGKSLCAPSGHSDAQPAGQDTHHDGDCLLCGFACTMATCAPALLPALAAILPAFGDDRVATPAPRAPALAALRLHPSDIGSRAPPVRA